MQRAVKLAFSMLIVLSIALGASSIWGYPDPPVNPMSCRATKGKQRTECCNEILSTCVYGYCQQNPECMNGCMYDYNQCLNQ